MCGIAGIISLGDAGVVETDALVRMTRRLGHRGPDDEATYVSSDGSIGLGSARLAVIDLPGGGQPIANEDGTVRVVCNGEIYNFRALRERLHRDGHRFTTAGDIEPVIHLYEAHGMGFLDRLDGFFALAVVDHARRQVTLACDRLGQKPLYYAVSRGAVYFASELKALQAVGVTGAVDADAMMTYLRFGWIPAPKTIYGNVSKLGAGHCVRICQDSTNGVLSARPYYRVPVGRYGGGYDQARRDLERLLTDATAKRLVADVPVGVLLSGGLDSAVVTALAAKTCGEPVKTFTVGFEDSRYDERAPAAETAARLGTDHHEVVVRPDLSELIERMVSMYDEPFADSSAIPTYLICRYAREHVKVVLTGDGGDEAFAGYDRYRALAAASLFGARAAGLIGGLIARVMRGPGAELRSRRMQAWRMVRSLGLCPAEQYAMFLRVWDEQQLAALAGPALGASVRCCPDAVAQAFDACACRQSVVQQANYADYQMYLPGDLLVKVDRASMASGLETRSPFLDQAVVEFALSLPVAWRMGVRRGKRIVRDVFARQLPRAVVWGGKAGFGVPMGRWLRGPLAGSMRSRLNAESVLVRDGWVRSEVMTSLVDEHLAGRGDHGGRLWGLMVLDEFVRRCAT